MKGVTDTAESTGRVLLADDEPLILRSLEVLLAARGYEVQTAPDGLAARELLDRRLFDVAVIDLNMPRLDGFAVMEHVRRRAVDTEILVVSGDTSIDSAIRALQSGADDFVRKPYAPEVLLNSVENAVRRRRLERERAQMQARLVRSEKLYRYLVNHSPDIVYTLDGDGHFRFINERAEALLGYSRRELLGRHFCDLLVEEDREIARYAFAERRAGNRRGRSLELRLQRKGDDRNPVYVENSFIPLELDAWSMQEEGNAPQRRFVGTYGVARDISGKKRAEATIQFQAYHDLLTRLPNRTLFKKRLRRALTQARRREEAVAVIYMDLDRFKAINDHFGHIVGDQLLCAVADRIAAELRQGDILARLGGDEFALLLPDVESVDGAERVAEKLFNALKVPFLFDGQELFTSISMGIAMFPQHGDTADALLKNADIAMYHGRTEGRGNYTLFDTAMEGTFSRYLTIETGIRQALEGGHFEVHFQPQMSAEGDAIVGFEALVRWEHPELGPVSPVEFIPVAEESGLIVQLGDWVLRQACEEAVRWREAGYADVRIAINFSALQLARPDFVTGVVDVLEEYGLPGTALEVEITENVLMNDMERVAGKLRTLSRYGITVAIDDFGTGYSSLSYLQTLPINRIKIDRSFIRVITEADGRNSIVAAIIAMANGLGMSVIAEGVESGAQRDYLAGFGCVELQGFLFSRPVPSQTAHQLLGSGLRVTGG